MTASEIQELLRQLGRIAASLSYFADMHRAADEAIRAMNKAEAEAMQPKYYTPKAKEAWESFSSEFTGRDLWKSITGETLGEDTKK